jgi:inner membrane protein COX18
MGVKFRGWVRGWWELGWLSGIGRWKFFGQKLGSFGILVTVMEAIRVKCGSGEGLLSLLFKPFTVVRDGIQAAAARHQDNVALEQMKQVQQQYDISNGVTVGSAATTASPPPTPPPAPAFETDFQSAMVNLDPTLQTEGLSFCPDLTLADPTGILPQCLLAVIVLSAFFSPRALEPDIRVRSGRAHIENVVDSLPGSITPNPDAENAIRAARKPGRGHPWPLNRVAEHVHALTFPQRITMFVGLYFFFIAQAMPAGMVLYLISSWTVGFVQRVWLDVRYPAVTPILPCSRPVRVKRRAP